MKSDKPTTVMDALRERYSGSLSMAVGFKTALSEVIGVAGFMVMGCGAAAILTGPDSFTSSQYQSLMVTSVIIGFAFGFGIFFMVSATAHNNSDQLNPAITLASMASGNVALLQGCVNILCQILGAIIGAGLVRALLPDSFAADNLLGCNVVPDTSTIGQAFLAEVIGMFFATYVILEISVNPRSKVGSHGPWVVGVLFGTLLTVLSPFSSGSLNPARSLGPAAIAHVHEDLWIFIFAPIVGALAAVPIHLMQVIAPSTGDEESIDGEVDESATGGGRKGDKGGRQLSHRDAKHASSPQRGGESHAAGAGGDSETFYPAQLPREPYNIGTADGSEYRA